MKLQFSLIVVLLFTNLSCSLFSEKISSEKLSQIKNIAIFSDLGDLLYFSYAGGISYKNHLEKVTSPWPIDSQIQTQILNTLKDSKKYETVKIVDESSNNRPLFDQMITLKRNGEKIKNFLIKLHDQGFDTLIIVQAWKQVEDENVEAGFGIFYNNRLLIHEQNFYLTAKVRVYDTASRTEFASGDLFKKPFISIDHLPKKRHWSDWQTNDLQNIKSLFDEKISNETQNTLEKLGLI